MAEELGWPIVVKPNSEGSSIGVQIAKNIKELSEIIEQTFSIDQEILLEEYIKGREITAGVLGNQSLQALPIVEIIPAEHHQFFDYEAKYKEKASREICPAELPESITRLAQEYALRAHRALEFKRLQSNRYDCSRRRSCLIGNQYHPRNDPNQPFASCRQGGRNGFLRLIRSVDRSGSGR